MSVRIIEGDCLSVLPTLGDASVDAVITDPPYGTTQSKWDDAIPLGPMWAALRHCVKADAPVLLFAAQPFAARLVASNESQFCHEWVWDKANPSGHLNAKRKPLSRHELIEVFCAGRLPYFPQMRKGRFRQKGSRTLASDCYGEQRGSVTHGDDYYPTTILPFSNANKAGRLHPNQKPLDLLRYLIRTYTRPGDTVLDFCAGSGTTGVAALMEGRSTVLIERHPPYLDIIRRRLAEVGGPLFAEQP